MRKINEVLRLKAAGLSVREIARSTGAAAPPCSSTWCARTAPG
jgi:hypothetical protein